MIDKIACRAICIQNGKILVVQHRETDDFWALPGGTHEKGETLDNCILREIQEELGVQAVLGNIAFIHELLDVENYQAIEFFYMIDNVDDFMDIDTSTTTHGFEIYRMEWVDIHDTSLNILPQKFMETLRVSSREELQQTRNIVSE